jgi:hypothetical protein
MRSSAALLPFRARKEHAFRCTLAKGMLNFLVEYDSPYIFLEPENKNWPF